MFCVRTIFKGDYLLNILRQLKFSLLSRAPKMINLYMRYWRCFFLFLLLSLLFLLSFDNKVLI